MKTKHTTHARHTVHSRREFGMVLFFATVLVSVSAYAFRLTELSVPPVSASDSFVDQHYTTRLVMADALGWSGRPSDDVIAIEGIKTPPPEAGFVAQSPKLLWLAPGKAVTISLQVKNVSKKQWNTIGSAPVSLKLAKNSGGELRHKWWSGTTVAKLKKAAPARTTATFRIPVLGPKDPGYYEETFELYQGTRKVPGGTFTIGAIVGDTGTPVLSASVPGEVKLTLAPGGEQKVALRVTNQGRIPWKDKGYGRVRLVPTTQDGKALRSASWLDASVAAKLPANQIVAGDKADLTLPIKAPTTPGSYQATFQLVSTDIAPIPNSQVSVKLTVPTEAPPTSATEPVVRVGIMSQTSNPTTRITSVGAATLKDAFGTVLAASVTDVTFGKSGTNYTYKIGSVTKTWPKALRVVGATTTVHTIEGWDSDPGYTTNDNSFRGTVEFRTGDNGATWVINELPLETYLTGLAETGSSSPLEYRKSIITAARTYALYHWSRKTKHAGEYYDLNSRTDQVYRGYEYEIRAPGVKEAVIATRGMVVFHPAAKSTLNPNGFALTAYSACTDGRTRSFQEVFGGDGTMTPYLVSVPDPNGVCTNQRYLQGLDGNHMVGLSGTGAIRRARDQGHTYDQILRHYYTGVTLNRFFQ